MSVTALMQREDWDAPELEAVFWGIAFLLGILLLVRAGRGARIGWSLVVLATGLIVVDKLFDLYSLVHALGRWVVHQVDPEEHMRGELAVYRNAALGGLLLLGVCALLWMFRRERRLGPDRLLAFFGIVVVMSLLAVRAMELFDERLSPLTTKLVEGFGWLAVIGGELLGLRRTRGPED